jgi:hypothetical protein
MISKGSAMLEKVEFINNTAMMKVSTFLDFSLVSTPFQLTLLSIAIELGRSYGSCFSYGNHEKCEFFYEQKSIGKAPNDFSTICISLIEESSRDFLLVLHYLDRVPSFECVDYNP